MFYDPRCCCAVKVFFFGRFVLLIGVGKGVPCGVEFFYSRLCIIEPPLNWPKVALKPARTLIRSKLTLFCKSGPLKVALLSGVSY